MKFGNIITAVATYAVLQILLAFPISIVALSTLGVTMFAHYSSGLAAVFLSMLTVGYLFREEISNGQLDAILRITVLSAFYEILVVVFQPTLADWTPLATELFAGIPITTVEWFLYDLSRRGNMFFNIIITMGLSALALYVGSKLKKTAKPK